MQLIDSLQEALRHLDSRQLRRRRRVADSACAAHMRIDGRDMLAFASNDYLGLAAHPALAAALAEGAARYGAGSGGSHLLGGHSRAHARLEDELAAFTGDFVERPRALYFTTGYMSNLATLGTLVGKGGTLFCDALNHASLIDGARLARADVQVYAHADLAALDALLAQCTTRERMIVTDSVFSMDGDIAPLTALLALAERHGAWLMVDDAHGFGVLGPGGRGAVAAAGLRSPNLIYTGTLGKAAGVAGAFVVAHETVIEWLVQRARPYIFTTASPPAVAHAVSASLTLIGGAEGDARRAQLRTLIDLTRDALAPLPWTTLDSRTPIQSLIVGANAAALALSAALDARGIWVPAIRPPTVPKHTARLRVSLSAGHTREDIGRLADALCEIELAVSS